jgi:hypothetical protein
MKLLLGCAAAAALVVFALAVHAQSGSQAIAVRILRSPMFFGDANCPGGVREQYLLFDADEPVPVGDVHQCDQQVAPLVFSITPEWRIAGGTLDMVGTATFTPDFSVISFDLTIVGGTGTYRNATGTATGGGPTGLDTGAAPDVTIVAEVSF